MLIYQITNKLNGKSYIGQTIGTLANRARLHGYGKTLLGRTIRKHGWAIFDVKTLLHANDLDELNYYEAALISKRGTLAPDGYNFRAGGDNSRLSEEHKKSISRALRGRQNWLGKQHTAATKAKMSAALLGNQRAIGKQANLGKKHSEETKRKMSLARLGGKRSDETRERMRQAAKFGWEKRRRRTGIINQAS